MYIKYLINWAGCDEKISVTNLTENKICKLYNYN